MSLSLLFIWLFALLVSPPSQGGTPVLDARAGFDGLYKPSTAMPVVVTIRNDGPPIEGTVLVSASTNPSNSVPVFSAPVSLPTGSVKQVPLVVYPSSISSGVSIRLVSDGAAAAPTITKRLTSVRRDDLLYGIITPDPGRLAFLETVSGGRPNAEVAFLTLDDLSEVSAAWNALDILIIDDTDTSRLTAEQLAAMRAWLDSGGQLVVTGGPGGPQTAAGVAELLPVSVSAVESVTDLSSLGEYTGEPVTAAGPFPVTISGLTGGESLIHQDGLPLLARRAHGRGAVYFLALDPKAAPLVGWAGADPLWAGIAVGAPLLPPWANGVQEGFAAVQSVSYIPGLRLPSVWQLIFFLFLYTIIIGPINYFVLRRMNRRELAWVTIPALVLLFSAITFFTGFRTRGIATTLNTMTVAFGSVDGEYLKSQSILGLYSPRRASYDIVLPYNSAAFPVGQDGTLIGGGNMDTIQRASELTLSGVRTDTSQVTAFIVDAHQPRPPVSATATLSAEGDEVEVTVRNGTGETLENAVLIYGQLQESLGNLPPGEERSVGLRLPTATITSTAMFPSGTSYYLNSLINEPQYILGTMDFYSDPVAWPRWQLIQSTITDLIAPAAIPDPAEIVTLGGWLPESAQEAAVASNTNRLGQTLLLLEIPVR